MTEVMTHFTIYPEIGENFTVEEKSPMKGILWGWFYCRGEC